MDSDVIVSDSSGADLEDVAPVQEVHYGDAE